MTASNAIRTSTGVADPNQPTNTLVPNAWNALAVTKSDSTTFALPTLGIYVGGAGDVAVRMWNGQNNVTFPSVVAGTLLPIGVDRVLSTGTTASNMVRVW